MLIYTHKNVFIQMRLKNQVCCLSIVIRFSLMSFIGHYSRVYFIHPYNFCTNTQILMEESYE